MQQAIWKWLIYGLLLWMTGHLAYVVADGLHDDGKRADMAVVLGNKVEENGTLSPRLVSRMRCALALYQHHRVKRILVSGGLGKEGYYEAEKMKQFLLKQGVSKACIVVDNYGANTEATVRNTLALRDSLHFNSLLVVSQYYHLTRTKMLFRKHHFDNVSSVSPRYVEWRDIYSLGREFLAYYAE